MSFLIKIIEFYPIVFPSYLTKFVYAAPWCVWSPFNLLNFQFYQILVQISADKIPATTFLFFKFRKVQAIATPIQNSSVSLYGRLPARRPLFCWLAPSLQGSVDTCDIISW